MFDRDLQKRNTIQTPKMGGVTGLDLSKLDKIDQIDEVDA